MNRQRLRKRGDDVGSAAFADVGNALDQRHELLYHKSSCRIIHPVFGGRLLITVRLSAVARSIHASFGETRRSLGEGGKPDTTYVDMSDPLRTNSIDSPEPHADIERDAKIESLLL